MTGFEPQISSVGMVETFWVANPIASLQDCRLVRSHVTETEMEPMRPNLFD